MEAPIRKAVSTHGARAGLLATGIALALWLAPSYATAETRVHLTLERPFASTCPTAKTLASDVQENARGARFTERESANIVVQTVIEEGREGVRARMEARTAAGELIGVRELEAESGHCAALRGPLALVLTILLELAPPAKRAWSVHGGVFGALITGILRRVRPELGLEGGFEPRRRFGVRAAASYWLPLAYESERGVRAVLHAAGLRASLCPSLNTRPTPLRVWICPSAQLGSWIATQRGLDGPRRHARLLANVSLELKLEAALPAKLALVVSLGPIVALSRPEFSYRTASADERLVERPRLAGGIFSLALIRERR